MHSCRFRSFALSGEGGGLADAPGAAGDCEASEAGEGKGDFEGAGACEAAGVGEAAGDCEATGAPPFASRACLAPAGWVWEVSGAFFRGPGASCGYTDDTHSMIISNNAIVMM